MMYKLDELIERYLCNSQCFNKLKSNISNARGSALLSIDGVIEALSPVLLIVLINIPFLC